jgi:protein-disulfide isomerase
MSGVIEAKKKKARFVYKLFPLRRASFPPVLALEVAAREGKFFEMLNRQFATQEQGFTIKRLRKMARELGMDPNAMEQKMRDKSLMQSIMKERKRAVNMGVSSTPSVFINGRMVGQRSRTPACLKQLIDQAAASEQEG